MLAHVIAGLLPDREQDALPLVIAGTVLMRLTEISEGDGTVDGGDDLAQPDLFWRSSKGVSASDAALGSDETRSLESQEDLLEIRLREGCSLGDVLDRRRAWIIGMKSERQECPAGIVTTGRDSHSFIVCLEVWRPSRISGNSRASAVQVGE